MRHAGPELADLATATSDSSSRLGSRGPVDLRVDLRAPADMYT